MTADKQPALLWSGPANSPSLGSPSYPDTPGLLAWLFGDTERAAHPHRTFDIQHQDRNRGSER